LPSLGDASYRDICEALGYSTDGWVTVWVIPSAIDESFLRGDREVIVTTTVNTTEDDLQFDLLLCLASTVEVIQRLHPTDAREIQRANASTPIRVRTDTSNDDLDVALLDCLTNTVEAIRGLLPTGADGDEEFFGRESEKVLKFTREKWQPRSQEPAFSLGSD
jgi:hypothetical protein